VAAASSVFREKHIAGMNDELITASRLKFQRPAQSQHELTDGRVVPFECAASLGLAEGDAGRWRNLAEDISSRAA
jgi:hypothetical protein